MEELEKKPTAEILDDMNDLDNQIWLLITRYNKLVTEITKRYPRVSQHEEFRPKTLVIRRK